MNPELHARLSEEAALDDALESVPAVEIPERLRLQLLTSFERFQERGRARLLRRIANLVTTLRELVWPGAPWWQPAFALSLSVLVGVSAGLVIPDSLPESGDQQMTNISDVPSAVDIGQDQ